MGFQGLNLSDPGKSNVVVIGGSGVNPLTKGGPASVSTTLTSANTDYAAAAAIPAGTKYVVVYCLSACKVAIGEATSATVGVWIPAAVPTTFPVTVTGVAADDTLHFQSASAGAIAQVTYLKA